MEHGYKFGEYVMAWVMGVWEPARYSHEDSKYYYVWDGNGEIIRCRELKWFADQIIFADCDFPNEPLEGKRHE